MLMAAWTSLLVVKSKPTLLFFLERSLNLFGAAGCPSKKLAFAGSLEAMAKYGSHSGQREVKPKSAGDGRRGLLVKLLLSNKKQHNLCIILLPGRWIPYLEVWQPSCNREAELRTAAQGFGRSPFSQPVALPWSTHTPFPSHVQQRLVALLMSLLPGFLLLVAEYNLD